MLDVQHLSRNELLHYARMRLIPTTPAAIEALSKALEQADDDLDDLQKELEEAMEPWETRIW